MLNARLFDAFAGIGVGSIANHVRRNGASSQIVMELMEPRLLLSAAPFLPAVNYGTGTEPVMVVSGDFDDDGNLDLATVNDSSTLDPGTISILFGKGDGTFEAKSDIATDIDPMALVVGDFNNDGVDDLAVANYTSDTVDIFLSKGDGTFQNKISFSTGGSTGPQSLAVGDFNGDENMDLAVGLGSTDRVNVYIGNGSGGFSQKTSLTVTGPISIAVGDFDADGKSDLAMVQQGSDTIRVVRGKGDGTFLNVASYATGGTPIGVAVGDFNNDDVPDLAVTSYTDETVSVLLGIGDGSFHGQVTFPTGLDPHGVAVGDLDLDGNSDLAIANWGDDTVTVLLGNGQGSFQATSPDLDVQSSPRSVVVDDFNGDGRQDLAVSNAGSDSVSILLGTGPTASDFARVINEGATLKLAAKDFMGAFSDPAGLQLQQVKIDSLPTHGTLTLKGVPVAVNQRIPASQLGNLAFAFSAGFAGMSAFGWQGYDGASYSNCADVDVWTTPKVSIVSNGDATEGGAGNTFTISLNVPAMGDLSIPLSSSGKAKSGKNYTAMPKKITIPAGQISVVVALAPLVDGVAKGDLSVIAKVSGGKGYIVGSPNPATMTIIDDDPKVSIVSDGDATEGGAGSKFTILLSVPALTDLTIPLSTSGKAKSGKKYTALPKSVTILAGQSSADVILAPLVDGVATGDLTVIAKVGSGKGYTIGSSNPATMNIVDDEPKVSITANPASTSFGAAPGTITFTRTGPTDQPLTFTITVKGTAKGGTDYTALPLTVTIDALQNSATIDIVPLVNVTKTKTVIVTAKVTDAFWLDPLELSALVSILHS